MRKKPAGSLSYKSDDGITICATHIQTEWYISVERKGHESLPDVPWHIVGEFFRRNARFYKTAIWLRDRGTASNRHISYGGIKDVKAFIKQILAHEIPVEEITFLKGEQK